MAEPVEEKLDIHDLLRQWERVVAAGAAAPDGGEMYAFVTRLMNATPQLAHSFIQHDDMCRAIAFLGEHDFSINARMKDGAEFDADELAEGYILMARHHGWKPPRECD